MLSPEALINSFEDKNVLLVLPILNIDPAPPNWKALTLPSHALGVTPNPKLPEGVKLNCAVVFVTALLVYK